MRCFPDTEVILFFDNGGPHLHTHIHILHYYILSDIMVIRDHGNICVHTIFMILSCIVFQILKILGFSIMEVLVCIHIDDIHIHKTLLFDHENLCVDTFLEMINP